MKGLCFHIKNFILGEIHYYAMILVHLPDQEFVKVCLTMQSFT